MVFVLTGIPPECVEKLSGRMCGPSPYRGTLKTGLHARHPALHPATTSSWSLSAPQPERQRAGTQPDDSRRTKRCEEKGRNVCVWDAESVYEFWEKAHSYTHIPLNSIEVSWTDGCRSRTDRYLQQHSASETISET